MQCYEFMNTTTFILLSATLALSIISYLTFNNEDVERILLIITCVIIDIKIVQIIRRVWFICKLPTKNNRIFLYSVDFNEQWTTIFQSIFYYIIVIGIHFAFLNRTIDDIFTIVVIFFLIVMSHIVTPFHDKNDILESNQLNIGYGAALSYYKNYLEFFIPYKFNERIETFKTYHQVDVVKKLFILVPKSSKVHRYISEPEIERCQELPPQLIPIGGVRERVYNITVYLIKFDENGKGIRMAVEYAQPLKALYSFKEKQLITEQEMYYQREQFYKELQNFLRDKDDSYKYCELIDYDDEKQKVSNALLERYYKNLQSEEV